MARQLHPRIAIHSEEDQQKILAELAAINEITKIVWYANSEAAKRFNELACSQYEFVREKASRLNRLLDETQQGIEATIIILP